MSRDYRASVVWMPHCGDDYCINPSSLFVKNVNTYDTEYKIYCLYNNTPQEFNYNNTILTGLTAFSPSGSTKIGIPNLY